MLRLINFLLIALLIVGFVAWITFRSLSNNPESINFPGTVNKTLRITPSQVPPVIITAVPSEEVVFINLERIILDLGKHLGIPEKPQEFAIESSPSSRETVLGYKYEIYSEDETVGDDIDKVLQFFTKNKFEIIFKDEYFESDPFMQYDEYKWDNLNCFMNAYSIDTRYFVEVGCNSNS